MRALITGITGQDGSYLAELLLNKGYEVHGLKRRSSSFNTERIDHIDDGNLVVHYGDLLDYGGLAKLIKDVQPTEIYNLAAQSHVRVSFDMPGFSYEATGLAAANLADIIRSECSDARLYQASSSEMYGATPPPQTETSKFHPRSPYATAKVMAFHAIVNAREAYGLHASNGILFNHESPRRGETFVTRKISRAVARIHRGIQNELTLGNLDAVRDWGFAGDYVEAMWRMLQKPYADDYVIATGEGHSVRDFARLAFKVLDLDFEKFVRFDSRLLRPTEVDALIGDYSKAKAELGWEPSTSFSQLVEMMVLEDLRLLDQELAGERVRVDR